MEESKTEFRGTGSIVLGVQPLALLLGVLLLSKINESLFFIWVDIGREFGLES